MMETPEEQFFKAAPEKTREAFFASVLTSYKRCQLKHLPRPLDKTVVLCPACLSTMLETYGRSNLTSKLFARFYCVNCSLDLAGYGEEQYNSKLDYKEEADKLKAKQTGARYTAPTSRPPFESTKDYATWFGFYANHNVSDFINGHLQLCNTLQQIKFHPLHVEAYEKVVQGRPAATARKVDFAGSQTTGKRKERPSVDKEYSLNATSTKLGLRLEDPPYYSSSEETQAQEEDPFGDEVRKNLDAVICRTLCG